MFDIAASLANQGDDICQRLSHLRDKIMAVETLLGIPADLAGEKNCAAFGDDAVGKAFRLFPFSRMKEFVRLCHGSGLESNFAQVAPDRRRKRWIFPVCVFGSASTNFTDRGYLKGAIVALT